MAWGNPLQEAANSKPLFINIYITVIIGIILSAFYVFSTIYSPDAISSFSSSSTLSGSFSLPALNASEQSKLQNQRVKPIWEAPSRNSKLPPLKTFRLTKELVEQRVRDNIIVVTFGNYAFMDFILTWVKHLTDLGISNLLVGALDTELLEALYWKGIPAFDMGSHMSTMDLEWGSPAFHKMGREKIFLINSLLPFGYELLLCDSDVIWLKDPLPYFARYPEADILTSTDQVAPTFSDDRLEAWQQVREAYNIGFFLWRPTKYAIEFAREWKELLLANAKIWDQKVFNYLLRTQLGPSVDDESGLVYAYDRHLKIGLLPASIFCSGHTYFVQAVYKQLRLQPYAVHTTYQYAGMEGKRHRLREAMLFYDPPEYYNTAGGFLSFKPFIPESVLLAGNHSIESHFKLVNHQLKQIRTALAIASLLKRTLVMPPIWCRLDRLWYAHPGKLKGSMLPQPFLCPLDHVFEVDVMVQKLPVREFGPQIDIREYSFFDNPSLPQQVKQSWLDVRLCQAGSKGCQVSNSSSTPGLLSLPKHSSEETLKTVFSAFKDVKVIQFLSMQDAFSGFTDEASEQKFRKRVKKYVGLWCCMQNHTLGHIYYDMYWDEKPGWKPVPPKTQKDNHPPY